MRKVVFLIAVFGLFLPALSFFPFFYGSRSLALGYSSLAFNYDVNAAYLNPSLLSSLTMAMGGYQFQSSYLDYRDVSGLLSGISIHDLENFSALDEDRKAALVTDLKEVFASRSPINGFQMRNPGYAGKNYAVAVAFVDAAIIQPLANPVLAKAPGEITDADIASLGMRIIGFHYTDYSLAVAIPVARGVALGATAHYLKGENTEFTAALTAEPFRSHSQPEDLLKAAWSGADHGFSKLNFDLGASAEFGQYFKAGIVAKNFGNPVIGTEAGELRLTRRLVAGLAFRPDGQTGIYLDIDVTRGDLYQNGQDAQPVSFGIEKGLFRNRFFLRAGFMSDLAAKYFLGPNANILYGMGLGFNLGHFLVDLALGLDPQGRVKNLGISGFYMLR
jgi:hypothetical protein